MYYRDARVSPGPGGREHSGPGSRSGEVRNQAVCMSSRGCQGLLSLAVADQLLTSACATGERPPQPSSEKLLSFSAQRSSIIEQPHLCTHYKFPEEKQVGPARPGAYAGPCSEEQGWVGGGHGSPH